jgi:hypothetical protein
MTQGQATLAAAAIAATAALIGALATGTVALRNETRRRRAAAMDSDRLALRSQAANLFVHIFHLQHEMEWLTWHAAKRPGSLDVSLAAAYESAVHAVYPKVLGAMAVLASLDLELYQDSSRWSTSCTTSRRRLPSGSPVCRTVENGRPRCASLPSTTESSRLSTSTFRRDWPKPCATPTVAIRLDSERWWDRPPSPGVLVSVR